MSRHKLACMLSGGLGSKLVLSVQIDAYEGWLNKELKKQKKLKPHEDPVLKSADVDAKLDEVRKQFTKLKNKKQPKPPKPAAPANDSSAGDETATPGSDQTPAAEEQPDLDMEVGDEEGVRLDLEEGSDGESAAKDEL